MTMTPTQHPALAALPPQAQQRVSAEAQAVALPAGETIFRPGDACGGLPLVLEGSVRVQMIGCAGSEIVLYRINTGEACALSIGCLMAGVSYRAEGIVETDTRAVLLPLALFDDLMGESAMFRQAIMAAYAQRLDTLMLLVEEVAFRRVDDRLAELLLRRAADAPLAMTHQQLAVELGTAREVVSRVLKEFERQGMVGLSRGRISVNAAVLRARIN